MAKKIQHRIRRSNNEGSIFQRKSDGKWVGSITVGHDEKGQQKKNPIKKRILLVYSTSYLFFTPPPSLSSEVLPSFSPTKAKSHL